MRAPLLVVIWILVAVASQAEQARPLTVFAAASLGDALKSASETWPAPVRLSLGGSGAIARQIDQGAPADVVMLANTDWMDWLETRGVLQPDSRRDVVRNRLVLVGPKDAKRLSALNKETILERLEQGGRLAMGEHRSVPAGIYARLWLDQHGLWDALRPRLAEVDNVRAAFALVARGEVPLAILYASDLIAAPDKATPVWTIPDAEQPDIRYALAAITPEGRAFVVHLSSPESLVVFERFGFVTGATD